MATLVFYDKQHKYELDGVEVPSVSEILRFLNREAYDNVNQYALDNAAERGTAAHKAIQELLLTGECEISAEDQGYIIAFAKFVAEHDFKMEHCELPLACEDFAGTIDLIGIVDGKRAIIDIKTVCAVHKTLIKAQLNGYDKLLYNADNYYGPINKLYCLQLMTTGKYRLYPVILDREEFNACLALHKAAKRKHGRGIIE
jgi:hypothetical protein